MRGLSQSGLKAFSVIWSGQLVSSVGSALTAFGLGIWVYQNTGSVTSFGAVMLVAMLPKIAAFLVAGMVVDHYHPRWVMIVSDTCAAFGTLVLAALVARNSLELWHVYLLVAFTATCNAFYLPANGSMTAQMVPKKDLQRANGMAQLTQAASELAPPVLGSLIMSRWGLTWIIVVDVASFIFASLTQIAVGLPRGKLADPTENERNVRLGDFMEGWRFLSMRRGLMGLSLVMTYTEFTIGAAAVLFTPLVLSRASVTTLGVLLTAAGLATLAGAVLATLWAGPKRRVFGVMGFNIAAGAGLVLAGATTRPLVMGVGVMIGVFFLQLVGASNRTIWQCKIPVALRGRVISVVLMLAFISEALAYSLSGALADRVFEPLFARGGSIVALLGPWIGTGAGRGIGALLSFLGLTAMVLSAGALLDSRVRYLDREIPDALRDSAPSGPASGREAVAECKRS
ncbi:MFS transporter [Pendulispora rubella]|uniref:MFS transporter n=1 Tax=Pendulispora rubella TaxID=2741070 RepID=A0ABZ2L7J2_9BACT